MKKLLLTLLGGVLCCLNLMAATTIGLTSYLSETPTKTIDAPVYSNGSVEGITVTSAIGSTVEYHSSNKTKTWGGYSSTGWAFNKTEKTTSYTQNQWCGFKMAVASNKKASLTNLKAKIWSTDTDIKWKVVIEDNLGRQLYTSTGDITATKSAAPDINVAAPAGVTNLTAGDYYVKIYMYQNGGNKYFLVPYLTVDVTVEDDFNTNSPVIDTDINSSYDVALGSSQDFAIEASNYSTLTWYEAATNTPNPTSDTQLGTGKTLKYTPSVAGTTYVYCYAYNDYASSTKYAYSTVATVTTTEVPVTSVTTTASLNMLQYAGATLTATVSPANASNKNVTWSTSDANVVTVDPATGEIYAKAVGTADITVTTEDGSKTATCTVTVSAIPGEALFSAVPVEGQTLNIKHQADATEVTSTYATISGGKVYLYNGHSSTDADMVLNNTFNVAGSGGSYIHLEFDNALKVGDVIVLKDYYGNGVSKTEAFYVSTSITKGSNKYSFPYEVTDASPLKNAKDIYLWRNVENAVKTIEVYGVVPFDDGSRTLSWTPNLNKSESSIGTASKPAVSATITAASDITNNGSLTITGSAKTDLTSKIESLTEKGADKYMSVSFTMASGNGFCPTTVTVPVQAISYDALVDLVLTDGTNTIEKTGLTAKNGALENKTITNTNNVIFSGDVTLKIYVYGQTAGYRLGAPISIVGFEGTKKSLNASGYASFSNAEDVKVFGADVNKASVAGTTITLTKVDGGEVPANNGVLLSGNASQDYIFCPVKNATAIEGNVLLSTNGASVGSYDWVLSGNQFKRYTGASFDANKAYLHFDTDPFAGSGAKGAFSIVFDGDNTTAVAGVAEAKAEVKAVKFMKNGQLLIKTANGFVNAAGAQVK